MIVEFSDREYVDIEKIVALRWVDNSHKGLVIFTGERIVLNASDFKIVEDAFRWINKSHLYGKDRKVKQLVERGE